MPNMACRQEQPLGGRVPADRARGASTWSGKAAKYGKEAADLEVKLSKAEKLEREAAERARQRPAPAGVLSLLVRLARRLTRRPRGCSPVFRNSSCFQNVAPCARLCSSRRAGNCRCALIGPGLPEGASSRLGARQVDLRPSLSVTGRENQPIEVDRAPAIAPRGAHGPALFVFRWCY
jgi:hypothetical protein